MRDGAVAFEMPRNLAYRPSTRKLFTLTVPRSRGFRAWHVDKAGQLWSCSGGGGPQIPGFRFMGGPVAGDLVLSSDGGRHFQRIKITVAVGGTEAVAFDCHIDDQNLLVIGTDHEGAPKGTVGVRWNARSDLVTQITPLDTELSFNPWVYDTLPGPRLVLGTNRPGLLIATDATNQSFELLPGPVPPQVSYDVQGRTIVSYTRHNPWLSIDEGSTWHQLDLQGRSWASPR
jgi:hypothetical protein